MMNQQNENVATVVTSGIEEAVHHNHAETENAQNAENIPNENNLNLGNGTNNNNNIMLNSTSTAATTQFGDFLQLYSSNSTKSAGSSGGKNVLYTQQDFMINLPTSSSASPPAMPTVTNPTALTNNGLTMPTFKKQNNSLEDMFLHGSTSAGFPSYEGDDLTDTSMNEMPSPIPFNTNGIQMPINDETFGGVLELWSHGGLTPSGLTPPGMVKAEHTQHVINQAKKPSSNRRAPRKQYRRKACMVEGCTNLSRSKSLCKAHGGGRRCSVPGCTRASQSSKTGEFLCISHGGGRRCVFEGCNKAAQSKDLCKNHGGGVRCKALYCDKSSQGNGFCRSHGGGQRCIHENCMKWAQRNQKCTEHSNGQYGNSYLGRLHRAKLEAEAQQLQSGPQFTSTGQPITFQTATTQPPSFQASVQNTLQHNTALQNSLQQNTAMQNTAMQNTLHNNSMQNTVGTYADC